MSLPCWRVPTMFTSYPSWRNAILTCFRRLENRQLKNVTSLRSWALTKEDNMP